MSANENITFMNMTISNNERGIDISPNSSPIINSIIVWDNNLYSISYDSTSSAMPIVSFSNIQDGLEGEGNIDSDPMFANPDNNDYTLLPSSPCIDTGNPNLWYQDILL